MSPIPSCGDWIRYAIGYGAVESDEERLKVLDAAYAAGSTFWDTANVYGDSEDLIGKCFLGRFKLNPENRSEIFLATKFEITTTEARGDPDYVKEQCAQSLVRLGVEYIDLYYQHRWVPFIDYSQNTQWRLRYLLYTVDSNTPIEKRVGAMADLVKAGKVKYLGLSDCTADGLRRAHAVHPIAALQIEYSPLMLEVEKPPLELVAAARALGMKIIAYSPLGRGFLTDQIKSVYDLEADDSRRTAPEFSAENFRRILALAGKIGEVGKVHGATAGQTTLAWTWAHGEDFFFIPGTKKEKVGIFPCPFLHCCMVFNAHF
ncbi:NADP-dependent oxidoreductase domain-containing protein [Mycena albidolilacea]|uniref:NADP-dependent oxidoreductase domain-containing protein n=1 Tax=Mycena albidolilacea TaxID=1033008 RepID=A0AAD6ZA47_9AGAR|nr:NADP-dependent oxidoreductase domain-containing protein [Mycena albidolilacea]